jgi:hypothetical protein
MNTARTASDRRRHPTSLEWLPAHGGVPCGVVLPRWVIPVDAELDLLAFASLN